MTIENTIDEKFWIQERDIPLNVNYLTLLAVHGNLCLALRHPANCGKSRGYVVKFVKSLGEYLVHVGAITPELLAETYRVEVEGGSHDLQ